MFDNPMLRYEIGKVYILFLGIALAFNLVLIIFESSKGIKLKYRRKMYEFKVKAALKK